MKEPKRYYCGSGVGMFEDDKIGHWIEYSEHKAIVEALSEQLRLADVVGQSEQLKPNGSYYTECECGNLVHAREKNCKKCGL